MYVEHLAHVRVKRRPLRELLLPSHYHSLTGRRVKRDLDPVDEQATMDARSAVNNLDERNIVDKHEAEIQNILTKEIDSQGELLL